MDRENKTLQKPKAPDVIPGNIPDIMKNTPSWVLWKYENRDGKYSKIPYFYNHAHNRYERASSDNAGTWGTFEEVYTHYKKSGFDGIGFVFYDKKDTTIIKETKWGKRPTLIIPNGVDLPDISFSGMDIDHVINKETGVIDEKAAEIIEKLNTYTEFSPSGTGTHSYCIGPFKGENLKAKPFEFYYHTRFFTVTGNIYGTSRPIREGGEILQSIVGMIREERDRRKAERNASTQGPSCQLPTNNHAQHSMGNSVSNGAYNPNTADEVIETIRNHARGKQASLFSSLYDRGEINAYGNDESAADMALMNILPFWCNGNPDLMESVFSLSSLGQREKWKKRPDYRKMTIEKALASWNGKTFNPPRDRGQGKEETGNALFQLEKIPPGAENSMHWPDIEGYRKVKNEKGEKVEIPIPRKTSPQNMAYFLKRVGIKARYNLLSKKAEYTGPGAVYYNPAGKRETLGEEVDENAAALTLRVNAERVGWKVPEKDFIPILNNVVMADSYNPVCDYLNRCREEYEAKGEGKDFIHAFFQMVVIQPEYEGNAPFYETLFKKWLLWAVVAAFNTIERALPIQGVLVLFSMKQGIGKSSFLKVLTPYLCRPWIKTETHLDTGDKDTMIQALGYWITELSELDDLLKSWSKKEAVKSFFTKEVDEYRVPYGKKNVKRPRNTVFLGTTNSGELITDPTGGRRFWIIPIDSFNFPRLKFTQSNPQWENLINFMWGQAASLLFNRLEGPELSKEESKKLEKLNTLWDNISNTEQTLRDNLDFTLPNVRWQCLTASQVASKVGIPQNQSNTLGRILTKYAQRGWIQKSKRHGAKQVYAIPLAFPNGFDGSE